MNNSARGRGAAVALPVPELSALTLHDLRDYREMLTHEEERVSYWRRLVQGRIDILEMASKTLEPLTPKMLLRALSETGTGARRGALLRVNPADTLPDLPHLDGLWAQPVDPRDPEKAAKAIEAMNEAERSLSDYRRMVHNRLDAATSELITRYKADPTLCFDLTDAA